MEYHSSRSMNPEQYEEKEAYEDKNARTLFLLVGESAVSGYIESVYDKS